MPSRAMCMSRGYSYEHNTAFSFLRPAVPDPDDALMAMV